MKKTIAILLVLVMFGAILTGCQAAAPAAAPAPAAEPAPAAPAAEPAAEPAAPVDDTVYEMIVATHLAENHPITQAMYKFAQLCEERSNGRLKFTTYINNELGDPTEVIDQIRIGVVDAGYFTTGHMAYYNDKLNATMWPYMFVSYEHANNAYKGEVGEYMKKMAADGGFEVLDWMYYGFRNLSANKEVNTVSDIKGLKLRVPSERVNQLTMSAYGGICTTIAFSELYLALSQGVVDGEENPIATMDSANIQEVNKYIAMIEYTFFTTGCVFNPDKLKSLPEDLQQIIREASTEAADFEMEIFVEEENKIIEKFKEQGVTFTYPDKAEFSAAAQPALDELRKDYDEAFVEEWLGLIEASKTA